jgi:acetolactate decarboxylase
MLNGFINKMFKWRHLGMIMLFYLVGCLSCQRPVEERLIKDNYVLSFKVLDTDFSKGRLGLQQEVVLQDLVRLHGHLCDGLIEGALALDYGLRRRLYPDGVIDRTNTRIVSRSSPCLADAAILLTGARYQYGTFFVNDDISGLYIVGKSDQTSAFLIKRKPGVKPVIIDKLGALAVAGELSPCALDSLRLLEDAYGQFLLQAENWDQFFEVISLESFNWDIPVSNNFIKTDILNKDLPACSIMIN